MGWGVRSWELVEREFLIYIGEVFSILVEEFGKNGLFLESFFIFKDVVIYEVIYYGGVGVDVNIKF